MNDLKEAYICQQVQMPCPPTEVMVKVPTRSLHEFHETYHSISFHEKDSKQCCDTTTPESIHTKDESKRGSAFAFIFGVN